MPITCLSLLHLLTLPRLPNDRSRLHCRSLIDIGAEAFPEYHNLRLQTENHNANIIPNSIVMAPTASKNSIDNVYLETLDMEDPHMECRVLRKIDFRLLPILGALYTIALIDRTNISVARISGLDDDLDLKVGNRASVVLLVSTTECLCSCYVIN